MIEISRRDLVQAIEEYSKDEINRLEGYVDLAKDWTNDDAFVKAGFIADEHWGWDKLRINKEAGVIIKEQYVPDLSNEACSAPYRIPTVHYYRGDGKRPIAIQPLADMANYDKRYEIVEYMSEFLGGEEADVHSGNVGYYKGLPVLIDW